MKHYHIMFFTAWNREIRSFGPVSPPSESPEGTVCADSNKAYMAQMAQTDALQANQLFWDMYAQQSKAMWKVFEILQNLNNDATETLAEGGIKRSKIMGDLARTWASVLGGYKLDDEL